MRALRYQALGPVLSGAGSRAFLGLEIFEGEARPIVLVWVPERIAQDDAKVETLDRETRWATRLDHPNILRVHGLARMEEGLARVVEFADGEPLSYILERSGALPAPFAGRIIADAALGVHYAHTAGAEAGKPLLHCGLRPGTLMLSYSGLTKVSGYGALSLVTADLKDRATEERRTRCAPEQIHGDPATPQTDVYLLGLTLYELLVGGVPFSDADAFRAAMLHGEVPALRLDDLPSSLVPVLRKATAKNPADRYSNALELREAIDECAGPLPTHNDLSRYLNDLMKGDERRSARQRELDAGIADFAKKQWQRRGNRRYSDEITAAGQLLVPGLKELREAAAAAEQGAPIAGPAPTQARTTPVVMPPPRPRQGGDERGPVPVERFAPVTAPPRARVERPAVEQDEVAPPRARVERAQVEQDDEAAPPRARAGRASVEHDDDVAPPRARAERAPVEHDDDVAPPRARAERPAASRGTELGSPRALESARPPPAVAPAAVVPKRNAGIPIAILAVSVLLVGIAAALRFMPASAPEPAPASTPAVAISAAPPSSVAAPPAAAPAMAPTPVPPPAAREELSPAPSVAPAKASTPPAAAGPVEFRLSVEPAVEVSIDGKPMGRAPVTATLTPGKHRVALSDPSRGIDTTRTVTVGRGGGEEKIELEKGSVTVEAPEGAEVSVDGKVVGKTPLTKEVAIYEGNHRIAVNLGKAKWSQKFSVRAGENMHFTVDYQ